jgi:alpha-1,2-mannosyltransferase
MISLARLDSWFESRRVAALSRLLALGQTLLLAIFIAGTHGWLVAGVGPNTVDFASFYAAGALADSGAPALAYDQKAHYAAEQRATEKGVAYEYYFYPPTFLLLCAPLARLPYLVSFVLFESATLTAWLLLCRQIAGSGAIWPLLACSSVWWTLGLGQNSLLSATLMAAGTLLLPRRPALAGMAFASLCFKPHLGLLVPVVLLAGRQYRAFAAAAFMLAFYVGASVLAFGTETWRAFLANEFSAPATLYGTKVVLAAHIDLRGAAMLLGAPGLVAGALQAAVTLLALCAVVFIWIRGGAHMKAAALAAGTLVVIPFALFYDLMLATVAGAWIVRAGRSTGFLAGEATLLALCVGVDLLAYPLGKTTGLPLGAVIAPILLGLCLRPAYREVQ